MERRDFCGKAGLAAAGLMAAPMALQLNAEDEQKKEKEKEKRRRYKIEIEIFEARQDTWCHKKGDKFQIPDDLGKICPWLLSSLWDFVRLLQNGVTLPWKYDGTPYEKVIDPDGVTTEYVRCPDPTSNLVAKITRTCIPNPVP
jgi:uncharacterized repeat protein (TIGR04076 family)